MKLYPLYILICCLCFSFDNLSAQAPDAPSNTVVNPLSPTSISVSWTINSSDHDGFVVQRRTGNSGPFDREFGSDQPPYIDTESITVGDIFCYRIRAVRSGIRSAASNVACAEVPNLPSAPTTLQGDQNGNNAIVTLTWNDTSNNESGFNIYRSDSSSDFTLVGVAARNAETFDDRSANESTTYLYKITAINAAGESSDSNETSVEVAIGDVALPTGIMANSASESSILVSWGFGVYNYQTLGIDRRVLGASTWTEVANLEEYAEEYLDENLNQNTTYCYRLRASNENGSDTSTAEICSMTQFGQPDAPSAITVEGRDEDSISVSWEAEDLVGHFYRVERNRNSGGFSIIEEDLTTQDFVDTGLDYAATYCYRILVYNDLFRSSYSPTDCGIVSPPEVTGLEAILNANDQSGSIDLSWDPYDSSLGAVFVISYGPEGEEPTEVISNTNSYTLTDLSDGTRYVIRVQARRQRGAFESKSEGANTFLTTYMIFWPGDTNGDGNVNAADFVQLTSVECFGKTTSFTSDGSDVSWAQSDIEIDSEDPVALRCDTDRDGQVTIFDALAIIHNSGQSTSSSRIPVTSADLSIGSDEQYNTLVQILNMLDAGDLDQARMKEELQDILNRYKPSSDIPIENNLNSNYPNPFSSSTTLDFDLAFSSNVKIEIFDLTGRSVLKVLDSDYQAGNYQHEIDFTSMPAGTYLVAMSLDDSQRFTKILSKIGSSQ